MIDFACKKFDLDDIMKCGLGLTKAEFEIMQFFVHNRDKKLTSADLSESLELNLTTIQKAVKKLSEKNIVKRYQKNLDGGGYIYLYQCNSKKNIRDILKSIIRNWSKVVEDKINEW